MGFKRLDYYTLKKGIEACKNYKGGNFHYALAKNLKKVNEELIALESGFTASKEWKEFDGKRQELLLEFCAKDKVGNIMVNPLNSEAIFLDKDSKEKFEEKFEELKTEYTDVIEKHDNMLKEKLEYFKEEVKKVPNWIMISKEDVPEDAQGDLALIEPFLE